MALAALSLPLLAQDGRGKAELKAGSGSITIDYGRPELKGRDPMTWQKDGMYWRMGSNAATMLTTPVDLMFGSHRVAKGSYSLWLLKESAESYKLVINTGKSSMNHDVAADVAQVPLNKGSIGSPVEALTLTLEPAPGGGTFSLTWAKTKLSTSFKFSN